MLETRYGPHSWTRCPGDIRGLAAEPANALPLSNPFRPADGKVCQHLTEFIHRIRGNALHAVFQVEPLQALMGEIPNFHGSTVTCSLTLVNGGGWARNRAAYRHSLSNRAGLVAVYLTVC
jgi:hypothetical protein